VLLLLCAGCYDLDALPGLFNGDGGTPALAMLTVLAGQPGGRFDTPSGVAVIGGDAIVVDRGSSVVLRVSLTSGQVTHVAGIARLLGKTDGVGARALFRGPRDLALLGSNTTLYLTDTGNSGVRSLDPISGTVTTIAGAYGAYGNVDGTGASAHFGEVAQVTAGPNATIYVVDLGTSTVRSVLPSDDSVVTIAGTAFMPGFKNGDALAGQLSAPAGVAATSDGNLFIADTNNRLIRSLDLSGMPAQLATVAGTPGASGVMDGVYAAALFSAPQGVLWTPAIVYVTDAHTVRALDLVGRTVTTIAGTANSPGFFDATLGTNGKLHDPYGMGTDDAGNLYVADQSNHALRRVGPAPLHTVTTVAGVPSSSGSTNGGMDARFTSPNGVAYDGQQWLVADTGNHDLRAIDAAGNVTTFAGQPTAGDLDGDVSGAMFRQPYGIALGGDGTVYVSDVEARVVRAISGGMVKTVAGTVTMGGSQDGEVGVGRFSAPAGLAVDGNILYVADVGNGSIRRVDLSTSPPVMDTWSLGVPSNGTYRGCATTDALSMPVGLAVDAARRQLYVTAAGNCQVLAVGLDTSAVAILIGTSAQLAAPTALAFDGDHTLYFADAGKAAVGAVDVTSGALTSIGGGSGVLGATAGPLPGPLSQVGGLGFAQGLGLVMAMPLENAIFVAR